MTEPPNDQPPAPEHPLTPEPSDADGVSLDLLLNDPAAMARDRFIPGSGVLKVLAGTVKDPVGSVSRGVGLAARLAAVAAGTSQTAPERGDRRFADPAWRDNPVFHRVMQAYLEVRANLEETIAAAGLDVQEERRLRLAVDNLMDAGAPTNFLLTNPQALQALVDTRGGSLLRGARNFLGDISKDPRLPSNTRPGDFTVGQDLAATPGAVVHRTEIFELLQYTPQTPQVRRTPVVIVPPMINKYYLLDLAPDRSLVEHLVRAGQQVFAISWRNPDHRHAHWDLDSYASAALEAIEVAQAITRTRSVHLAGSCSGGALAAAVTAYLVQNGTPTSVRSLMLAVCVLDSERAGVASAFSSRPATLASAKGVAQLGYLPGEVLQGVFAWLRPQDLIWPYVVNNYLLGNEPPAFDLLYWNADVTRLVAGLYQDLADLALDNSLAHPGGLRLLDTPIDLAQVSADAYVVAGVSDHITPWENCYRATQLLSGDVTFVLSRSGHVAALVNPAANTRSHYRIDHGRLPADPEAFVAGAQERTGSWWPDWSQWLASRSGTLKAAPAEVGSTAYPPIEPAPGHYVHPVEPGAD